jgi:hypothetical protein
MKEVQRITLYNKFIEEPKEENDTIIPQSLVSLSEDTAEVARDESDLSYNELLEDYIKFKKPAIMKLHTFNRLWN